MSESQFSKRMRDKLEALGVKCYRIESARTSAGIPDIHYVCRNGVSGWIETKQVDQPPPRVPYEPTQALWLDEYANAGGRCCTLVHIVQLDRVLVVPGKMSIECGKHLLPFQNQMFVDLSRKDAWLQIRCLLCDVV
jgi:hypothetical protein